MLDDPLWPAALRADRDGLVAGYRSGRADAAARDLPASYPPSAQDGGAAALGRRGAVQAHADQRHLPGRGQPGRRPPGRLQRVWRLRDRVQLRRQEHPDDELSARRRRPRGRRSSPRSMCAPSSRWATGGRSGSAAGTRGSGVRPAAAVVTADVVVIAAGTLGSNEILLRSAGQGAHRRPTGSGADSPATATCSGWPTECAGRQRHRLGHPGAEPRASARAVHHRRDRRPGQPNRSDDVIIEDACIPGRAGAADPGDDGPAGLAAMDPRRARRRSASSARRWRGASAAGCTTCRRSS